MPPKIDEGKRFIAAQAYLETGNISQAAKLAGVSRPTLQRWLKDPKFLEGVSPASTEPAELGLKIMVPKALKLVDSALEGKNVTASQLRAAMAVINASNALKQSDKTAETTLEQRIQALEGTDSD